MKKLSKALLKQSKEYPFILFLCMILLHVMDIISTKVGLATGHMYEANPVMRYVIENWGFNSLWIVKMIPVILISAFFTYHKFKNIMMIFTIFSLIPVLNNLVWLSYLNSLH